MISAEGHGEASGSPSDSSPRQIYRDEALDYYSLYQGVRGAPLRLSGAWTDWTYWLLVATVATALLYLAFGTVDEYATGPAVTRIDGRTDITVSTPGIVATVDVRPGQHVAANERLVSLSMAREAAEYERIVRLYEAQLVKTLVDRSDRTASQELNDLATQRALAKARLDERVIRAPREGVVSDVRIRPGHQLQPGEVLMAILGDDTAWSVIAMLPGHYRPMVHPGDTIRLEMDGYRYAYRDLTIDSVGDEVVGPTEVRRFLGEEISDAVALQGPVVLVQARLPSPTFTVGEHTYQYYDGLHGTAEARVNSERILFALIPGLRQLFPRAP